MTIIEMCERAVEHAVSSLRHKQVLVVFEFWAQELTEACMLS